MEKETTSNHIWYGIYGYFDAKRNFLCYGILYFNDNGRNWTNLLCISKRIYKKYLLFYYFLKKKFASYHEILAISYFHIPLVSTVYEDVAFGPRNYGYSNIETEEKVRNALRKVKIEKLKDRQIYRMSGGEKKLASIATILAIEPEVILLDEPSIAFFGIFHRNFIVFYLFQYFSNFHAFTYLSFQHSYCFCIHKGRQYERVRQGLPEVVYDEISHILKVEGKKKKQSGNIAVCTAGTFAQELIMVRSADKPCIFAP